MAAYVLNPLTTATCAAMSTTVFHNLILSLALLFIIKGKKVDLYVKNELRGYRRYLPGLIFSRKMHNTFTEVYVCQKLSKYGLV